MHPLYPINRYSITNIFAPLVSLVHAEWSKIGLERNAILTRLPYLTPSMKEQRMPVTQ